MPDKIYDVPAAWAKRAYIDDAEYHAMYGRSIKDPNAFWGEAGKRIHWYRPFTKVKDTSFDPHNVSIKWFEDGTTNAAYNCIDRHLAHRGDQVAIIWEGDDPKDSKHITYRELHDEVCRLANVLRNRNVKKGDRVTIYLPMIPEAAYAILACARIGAIHSVVFGGFSPDSLAGRIEDCKSNVVITADEGLRGGRKVPLKANTDAAIDKVGGVDHVIVVKRTGAPVDMLAGRDVWYHEAADMVTKRLPVRRDERGGPAVHPLYFGLDRKAQRRAAHHRRLSGLRRDDAPVRVRLSRRRHLLVHRRRRLGHRPQLHRLWPARERRDHADVRGRAELSDASRFWEVIDKHQVNIFYTAPTAIRALMQSGDAPVKKTSRASLRLLGSVGEPINPEAWEWYHRVVGDGRCPIVDTWWQTETGGILITPLPGATALKPGSATRPFFGVIPEIVDAEGKVLDGAATGNLCIADSWPGQMRTVYGDHQRFVDTYFSRLSRQIFHRRRLPPRRRRLLLDHRPRRRRDQRRRPSHGHGRSRNRRWSRTRKCPRRPSSAIRTTSKARASTPMSR